MRPTALDSQGESKLPGVMHHYVGASSTWQANVATFGRVVAHDVRPGIDVAYYGDQRQLEYDFIVAPGADPADAVMVVQGADRLSLDASTGDLLVEVAGQVLRQRAPVSYQEIDGVRRPVASAFTLDAASGRVGFEVGAYDRQHALVIDPGARVLDLVRRRERGRHPRGEGGRQRLHLRARYQPRTTPASR